MNAAEPRLRARRVALSVLLWAFVGILGGLSVVAKEIESYYRLLQMVTLPWPTEGFLSIARFVRSLAGSAVCLLAALGITLHILRGGHDRRLQPMTVAAVIGIILFTGVVSLVLSLPLLRISSH